MSKKYVIIHFQPLELYPPILNLLNFIGTLPSKPTVVVITTAAAGATARSFKPPANITISRISLSGPKLGKITRYLQYLLFYARSTSRLFFLKPETILYFETLSSFPVLLYTTLSTGKKRLFIHYHEYTSLAEYQEGMWLVRFFHKFEKKLYQQARWISHTNGDRLSMFKKDEDLNETSLRILPNYPPRKWAKEKRNEQRNPVKFIYVGSLSLENMYTENFAQWIKAKGGQFSWDVFSHNATSDALRFLRELNCPYITVHPGVDYFSMENILPNYDIGVILYTGHILNYIYNAPNKLFEYQAAGLDVWYPHIMKSCEPYQTNETYPRIISINFDELNSLDEKRLIDRTNLDFKPSENFAENVLTELTNDFFRLSNI
jgi:hypothetical protein